MSKLLVINSKDRINGTSTNFEILFRQYLNNDHNAQPKHIKLVGCQFSNCIYNVNSNNNRITFFETTGTSQTVTLTPGIYTGSTLLTALTTAMTAASTVSNTYTGTYSSTTLKYTIVASTQTFKFTGDYPLIGYYSSQTAALSLTGLYPAKILIDYLVVETNIASNFVSSFTNYGSFILPLAECPLGSVFYFSDEQIPEIVHSFFPNANMKFNITDPSGNTVDNNNFDIILFFEIC